MSEGSPKVPGYLLEGQLHQHGDRWYLFTPEGKRDLTSVLESMAGSEVRFTMIGLDDLRVLADELRGSDGQNLWELDDEQTENTGSGGGDPPPS